MRPRFSLICNTVHSLFLLWTALNIFFYKLSDITNFKIIFTALGSSFHDQIAVIINHCTDQSAKTFVQLIICIICLAVGNLTKETNLTLFCLRIDHCNPSFVLSAISASEANNVNLSLYGALAYGQKLLQLPHSLHM